MSQIQDTASLFPFLCSIVFSMLVWSKFPIGCCQGPIPVSKLYLTVAGIAAVFYLSDTAFSLLPLPFKANEIKDYLISDRFDLLPIAEHDVSIICCLFFDAIVLTLHLTRGSSSIHLQVTG